jgi:glycine cleavage system transcriptional repressor
MPDHLSSESLHRNLTKELASLGLEVHITLLDTAAITESSTQSEAFIITTKGPDRKGLVAGISEVIARFEGNITNLQAVFKGGSKPVDNIMIYEVDVPLETDQQALYQELKKRAHELALDIDIQHRNIFEAIHRV